MQIVDPLEFGLHNSDLFALLHKPTIATAVSCSIYGGKGIFFHGEDDKRTVTQTSAGTTTTTSTTTTSTPTEEGKNIVHREVGNVNVS